MRSRSKRLGILGGSGPRASAEFHRRLLQHAQTRWNCILDSDFPEIVHISRDFGLSEKGVDNTERTLRLLVESATDLRNLGCQVLALPCNSLHELVPSLEQMATLPVVDIIRSTVEDVLRVAPENSTVVVLSSESTQRQELYTKEFSRHARQLEKIPQEVQTQVTRLIAAVMQEGPSLRLEAELNALIRKVGSPQTIIVLGCTELSLLSPSPSKGLVIDSMTALVNHTLEYLENENL